ncbi:MAG: hypothetical protein PHV68_02470 [Candidatus Gastranaerophilales bacterium]|nr:hypothetical protein [Candidatus Gastranaerophilales bacterium]
MLKILAKYFIFFIFITLFSASVFAQDKIVELKQGTYLKGILMQNISTASNKEGDIVELINPANIFFDNIAISENTIYKGVIAKLEKPKLGQDGYFYINIDEIIFPDNSSFSIDAYLWTKKEGGFGGDFTKRTEIKKMHHRIQGIGLIAQIIPTGPRSMGKDFEIKAGEEFVIVIKHNTELIFE